MRTTPVALIAFLCLVQSECATSKLVPLLSAAGVPVTLTPIKEVPLEVATRGTNIADPLPVGGAGVSYTDVEAALGHAVASATVPWAEEHRDKRPDGWHLFVEITRAEAKFQSGRRLSVALDVRATLRARKGNIYIAQTTANCRQSALVEPDQAAPVLYSCMTHLGRELAGWLGAIEP